MVKPSTDSVMIDSGGRLCYTLGAMVFLLFTQFLSQDL